MTLYLDSSAIVKLIQKEAESVALKRYLRRHPQARRVTSALSRVEVVRAVFTGGSEAVADARRRFRRLSQIALDRDVLDRAATLAPGTRLRSLDAVHVASAQQLGSDLVAVVTYDHRMAEAAAAVGLPVDTPV